MLIDGDEWIVVELREKEDGEEICSGRFKLLHTIYTYTVTQVGISKYLPSISYRQRRSLSATFCVVERLEGGDSYTELGELLAIVKEDRGRHTANYFYYTSEHDHEECVKNTVYLIFWSIMIIIAMMTKSIKLLLSYLDPHNTSAIPPPMHSFDLSPLSYG